MIAYSVKRNPYTVCRKVCRTASAVWIHKKQTVGNRSKSIPLKRPIGNSIAFGCWRYIIHILRIVFSSDRCSHTDKLTCLFYNCPDISAIAYPCKFPVGYSRTIHYDCRDSFHAVISLSPGFTFQKPCKQLARIHSSIPFDFSADNGVIQL